jgi:hypothetical protein
MMKATHQFHICYNVDHKVWERSEFMKTFIVACVAAVVIAIVSVMVLNAVPDSAEKAFSSATSVRLGA